MFFFWILWWIEISKEQKLFEKIEIFCYILNVFIVFDQFNESLMNENINLFFLNAKTLHFWRVV